MGRREIRLPVSGFCQSDGFPYLLNETYAQVIPQRGLIPVICFADGFPHEEVLHHEALMLNLPIAFHALAYDWGMEPSNPVPVWKPFIEALSNIHKGLGSVENTATNDEYWKIQENYADAVGNDILTRQPHSQKSEPCKNHVLGPTSSKTGTVPSSGSSTEEETTEQDNPQQTTTQKLSEFIEAYLDQGLLQPDLLRVDLIHNDLVPRDTHVLPEDADQFLADDSNPYNQIPHPFEIAFTTRLIEIYLPFELLTREDRMVVIQNPSVNWQTVCSTLDRWTVAAKQRQSPFPIMQITPNKLIESQAALVTAQLAGLIGRIMFLRPHPERYLLRSLPAIFHLLHPLNTSGVQPAALPAVTYPYIRMAHDQVLAVVDELGRFENREQIKSNWGTGNPECQLYETDLDHWIGSEQRSLSAYALDISLQIWHCLRRLETIWQTRDETRECHHCNLIAEVLQDQAATATGFRLGPRLDQNAFTLYGLKPLLTAAKLYPVWLRQEILATYHHHPALPDPPTA